MDDRLLSKLTKNNWKYGMGEARISWLAKRIWIAHDSYGRIGPFGQTMACRAHLYARD